MLNSAEHENLNAHEYKNINKSSNFQSQIRIKCYFLAFQHLLGGKGSCSAELSMKKIITSGPGKVHTGPPPLIVFLSLIQYPVSISTFNVLCRIFFAILFW